MRTRQQQQRRAFNLRKKILTRNILTLTKPSTKATMGQKTFKKSPVNPPEPPKEFLSIPTLTYKLYEALLWYVTEDIIDMGTEQDYFIQGQKTAVTLLRIYCEEHCLPIPQVVLDREADFLRREDQ